MITSASLLPHHPQAPLRLDFGTDDGAAVSTHHLATAAATRTMREGGNAVDAAVAANAVLAVVLPDTCGPGGDLFALIHRPGMAAPAALNASGRAGSGVSAAALRSRRLATMPRRGPETVTVPGCVDGWEALLARFGSMSIAEVLSPAIELAENGFEVSTELAESLRRIAPLIGDQPAARSLYPGNAPPGAGTMVRRTDLAATLGAVAQDGRSAFYGGHAGAAIVAVTEGRVTPADLEMDQAEWVDPIGLRIHGLDAWTVPPNSQGYLTVAALWLAHAAGLGTDPKEAATHHGLIEAYRAAAWERHLLVGDPLTAPLAADQLLDTERLRHRVGAINDAGIAPWPAPAPAPGGTAYLCTRDASGLGVSLIQSNFDGVGSGLAAGDTGVFLHNRGAGFSVLPGPNELAPGRRPLHTLSPTLWTDGGELRLLLGTRGGDHQPQILLQVASHRLAAGLPMEEAIAVPRWRVDGWRAGETHSVIVEDRMAPAVVDGLRQRGHQVALTAGWQGGWGPVAAIEVDATGGTACGDRRVSTSGAAVT